MTIKARDVWEAAKSGIATNKPMEWAEKTVEALTLLAEVEEGKAHVMRWEPIETAPKGGFNILGARKFGKHWRMFVPPIGNAGPFPKDSLPTHLGTFNGKPSIPEPEE